MLLRALLFATVLAVHTDAKMPMKRLRDRPPTLEVQACAANSDPTFTIPGRGSRVAKYTEDVVITDARPNRNVFLTYSHDMKENGAKHSFSSGCGNLKHVGFGVATDMFMDVARITTGKKLVARANGHGHATFKIPVDACGKMYYQGFDWITSQNCMKTNMDNREAACPYLDIAPTVDDDDQNHWNSLQWWAFIVLGDPARYEEARHIIISKDCFGEHVRAKELHFPDWHRSHDHDERYSVEKVVQDYIIWFDEYCDGAVHNPEDDQFSFAEWDYCF